MAGTLGNRPAHLEPAAGLHAAATLAPKFGRPPSPKRPRRIVAGTLGLIRHATGARPYRRPRCVQPDRKEGLLRWFASTFGSRRLLQVTRLDGSADEMVGHVRPPTPVVRGRPRHWSSPRTVGGTRHRLATPPSSGDRASQLSIRTAETAHGRSPDATCWIRSATTGAGSITIARLMGRPAFSNSSMVGFA
jgi:hypothetical protein